jgi:hypothetical protein
MARLTGPYSGFPGNTTRRTTTQELPLGTRAIAEGGSEYVYIKAGATIPVKSVCTFQGSAAGYDDIRVVTAANQAIAGVADTAFASGEYGFLLCRGIVTALVEDSTAVGSLLQASDTVDGAFILSTAATDLVGTIPAVALTTAADSSTAGVVVCLG